MIKCTCRNLRKTQYVFTLDLSQNKLREYYKNQNKEIKNLKYNNKYQSATLKENVFKSELEIKITQKLINLDPINFMYSQICRVT